jgi:hypothetical protein
MDRSSMLVAVAKARVWASEGWKVTIIGPRRKRNCAGRRAPAFLRLTTGA